MRGHHPPVGGFGLQVHGGAHLPGDMMLRVTCRRCEPQRPGESMSSPDDPLPGEDTPEAISPGGDWMHELMAPEPDAERARRALLQVAEEISRSAAWIRDTSSDHMVWSENVAAVLDLDPTDVPPSIPEFLERVHPDDRDRVAATFEQARAGLTVDCTYRILTPRGATRYLHSVTAARLTRPGGTVLVGWVRDITKTRDADRQIATHIAVTGALRNWSTLEESGPRLLEDMARALGFTRATLWVPEGDVLVALAYWEESDPEAFAAEMGALRLRRGQGLAGRAWEQRTPQLAPDLEREHEAPLRTQALNRGLRGAISLPLIGSEEVLAAVTLAGPDVVELDERLRATLEGIAHELGAFLASRTGELRRPVLSAREREILQLAADGLSGPEIASRLYLSPATVKTHFENIYAKYEVPDRVSAVAKALREGLIK